MVEDSPGRVGHEQAHGLARHLTVRATGAGPARASRRRAGGGRHGPSVLSQSRVRVAGRRRVGSGGWLLADRARESVVQLRAVHGFPQRGRRWPIRIDRAFFAREGPQDDNRPGMRVDARGQRVAEKSPRVEPVVAVDEQGIERLVEGVSSAQQRNCALDSQRFLGSRAERFELRDDGASWRWRARAPARDIPSPWPGLL